MVSKILLAPLCAACRTEGQRRQTGSTPRPSTRACLVYRGRRVKGHQSFSETSLLNMKFSTFMLSARRPTCKQMPKAQKRSCGGRAGTAGRCSQHTQKQTSVARCLLRALYTCRPFRFEAFAISRGDLRHGLASQKGSDCFPTKLQSLQSGSRNGIKHLWRGHL